MRLLSDAADGSKPAGRTEDGRQAPAIAGGPARSLKTGLYAYEMMWAQEAAGASHADLDTSCLKKHENAVSSSRWDR